MSTELTSSRQTLRFVYRGAVRELRTVDPTMTVLRYLREVEKRCGTKEGCAEGDCGACTVVLGELHNGAIRYRAVNACIQFLPTLDGKLLLSVEDLERPDGSLHPAQQAMIDCDGSQCGFCTPGFVMALFALQQERGDLTRWDVDDALAGNLCRCTGYGPIIDAALRMSTLGRLQASRYGDDELVRLLEEIRPLRELVVGAAGRRYFAPTSLQELVSRATDHPDATILGGGTDVGLWVTKQHRDLKTLIHTGNVSELNDVRDLGAKLEIGAAVPYSDVFETIAEMYPDFGEILRRLGCRQIRNLGTIGGNIANGSPIGDCPPVLIVLRATLRLNDAGERREMPLEDFFVDYGVQDRRQGEIVESILLPKPDPTWRFAAYKISKRFDQDISAVCGAFNRKLVRGVVEEIRVCFGGMAAIPKRAPLCENSLKNKNWNEKNVRDAMAEMEHDYQPIPDMRASDTYRMLVAQNLLFKFYLESSGHAEKETRLMSNRAG